MSERVVIRNGRIIDPANHIDQVGDLYWADGRIVAVASQPDSFSADREISAAEKIVCPGFIDLCARFREPGREHKATIASESRAAAAAGITTVCCHPDTDTVIDTPAVANLIRQQAKRAGKTRILPIGALTRGLQGKDLSEMCAFKESGCLAVSNAHIPLLNTLILRRVLEYAASYDLLVIIRPEDPWLADGGCVHEGAVGTRLGLPGIPCAAETVALAQVLALLEHTQTRVHFAQLSSARAARVIARALEKDISITADVAIHHLHLTEADVDGFNALYHVQPPLRAQGDLEVLRGAVGEGVITTICSDHQPHEPDAKLGPFAATEPGISSLETLLPLTLALVNDGTLTLSQAIATLTQKPAEILKLEFGTLSLNAPADICIFDPEATWVVSENRWYSSGRNTPYWGQTLQGRVTHTFLAGQLVYQEI